MREAADFTPEERTAALVWTQKLGDRTLSPEQHEEAKRELDMLFERGFAGEIAKLRRRVDALEARIDTLTTTPPQAPEAPEVYNDGDVETKQAEIEDRPATTSQPEDMKRGPGRPSKRYQVNGSRGKWFVDDNQADPGMGTVAGPFKLKASAEEEAKRLESGGSMKRAGAIVDKEVNEAPPQVTAEDPIEVEEPSDDLFGGIE